MKEIVIKSKDVLKRALELLDISIEAYASSIDKDRATLHRYISGDIKIPFDVISNVLGLVYQHGLNITSILGIENEDDYYYHASNKEIDFPINVNLNDGKNRDFGYGFYLGENLRQSSTWGKLGYSTIIYRFKREKFKNLTILDFDNYKRIDWLNYIAINRHKIAFIDYPALFKKYKKLELNKDLIKGKIADSFSYEILELLYKDRIDIDQAEYSTCIMGLGNQYCLKNEEFARNLIPDEIIKYDEIISAYFLHYFEMIQDRQNKNVELIIKKPANPDRVFSTYLKKKYE